MGRKKPKFNIGDRVVLSKCTQEQLYSRSSDGTIGDTYEIVEVCYMGKNSGWGPDATYVYRFRGANWYKESWLVRPVDKLIGGEFI